MVSHYPVAVVGDGHGHGGGRAEAMGNTAHERESACDSFRGRTRTDWATETRGGNGKARAAVPK